MDTATDVTREKTERDLRMEVDRRVRFWAGLHRLHEASIETLEASVEMGLECPEVAAVIVAMERLLKAVGVGAWYTIGQAYPVVLAGVHGDRYLIVDKIEGNWAHGRMTRPESSMLSTEKFHLTNLRPRPRGMRPVR